MRDSRYMPDQAADARFLAAVMLLMIIMIMTSYIRLAEQTAAIVLYILK